jgi:hypothetical protein
MATARIKGCFVDKQLPMSDLSRASGEAEAPLLEQFQNEFNI